jgi:hypothetical protein
MSWIEYAGWIILAAAVIAILTVIVTLRSAADDYEKSEAQDE